METILHKVKVNTRDKLNWGGITGANVLVIPQPLYAMTSKMCDDDCEYMGWLIGKKEDGEGIFEGMTLWVVQFIGVTERGNQTHVESGLKYTSEVEDDFGIEFHTHHYGLNPYFYSNFSKGDFRMFKTITEEEDKHYNHVCFTPTSIMTYGDKTFDVVVYDYDERLVWHNFNMIKEYFEKQVKFINIES